MNTLTLAWRFLWSRPLGALLNVLLLGLGLASMSFLLLVGHQISQAFERDLAGVDAVVGAKGSPLQLILSGVLHLDVPPGNIPYSSLADLSANPMLASVIPLSLGDNFQGFHVVGTSLDYLQLYRGNLASGALWTQPMQAVVGATAARMSGLHVGSTFAGAHGLGGGGHAHARHPYTAVGVLQPTGSVLDRLILTDTASVWSVHASAEPAANPSAGAVHDDDEGHADAAKHHEAPREITMVLVRYKSPLAAVSFPRAINTGTQLQAAVPALEITRLLRVLGVGSDVLRTFAAALLITAALSVFMAQLHAVRERRAELAVWRLLGASPRRVVGLLVTEALWVGVLATLLGLAAGQGGLALIAWLLQLDHSLLIGGLTWPYSLWAVPAVAFVLTLAATLIPALAAYRVSVLQLLHTR